MTFYSALVAIAAADPAYLRKSYVPSVDQSAMEGISQVLLVAAFLLAFVGISRSHFSSVKAFAYSLVSAALFLCAMERIGDPVGWLYNVPRAVYMSSLITLIALFAEWLFRPKRSIE